MLTFTTWDFLHFSRLVLCSNCQSDIQGKAWRRHTTPLPTGCLLSTVMHYSRWHSNHRSVAILDLLSIQWPNPCTESIWIWTKCSLHSRSHCWTLRITCHRHDPCNSQITAEVGAFWSCSLTLPLLPYTGLLPPNSSLPNDTFRHWNTHLLIWNIYRIFYFWSNFQDITSDLRIEIYQIRWNHHAFGTYLMSDVNCIRCGVCWTTHIPSAIYFEHSTFILLFPVHPNRCDFT